MLILAKFNINIILIFRKYLGGNMIIGKECTKCKQRANSYQKHALYDQSLKTDELSVSTVAGVNKEVVAIGRKEINTFSDPLTLGFYIRRFLHVIK